MSKKAKGPFVTLNVAVLTVSDTRTRENDTSGDLVQERLETAGHKVVSRVILQDDVEKLRWQLRAWMADKNVDAVISTGGTGLTKRDVTPAPWRGPRPSGPPLPPLR
jgi:molybdenum cofactor biosynthesis protein B